MALDLRTADQLFDVFLRPLYPRDVLADLALARATDANPGRNPSVLAHLDEAAQVFATVHARFLGHDVGLDFSDASVHRLSAALTRDVRDALAAKGRVGTAESELFNVVVHGAAYVGACIVRGHAGVWLVRQPLWESRVRLQSHAGDAELAILSWWLRALSDEAFDDAGAVRAGLAERYRAYVEVPTTRPDDVPLLAEPRILPRLAKVRYDTFHKYIRAHLPELRDLGPDFPSADRFDAYKLSWLDFVLVGGGRMVLVCGPGEGGLHAMWLDHGGFKKSALFAADKVPEPMVRVEEEDKLAFVVSLGGETHVHETLWWGP